MKEIGGYIEFEYYRRPMLHENGILLNCGRSCLAYLIQARQIRRLAVPYFMCDSVFALCEKYGVQLRYYHIGLDFLPESLNLAEDEWIYLANYYGQLNREKVLQLQMRYQRVIVDNAQAYFDMPVQGVDTLYTCRKYFGVPDGAVLYTDARLTEPLERDMSMDHMMFLLGRFEQGASAYYAQNQHNNHRFADAPVLQMSALTENLLRSLDYDEIQTRRADNYRYLEEKLGAMNQLVLQTPAGPFAYPLLVENGAVLRKELIRNKIYVPTLWPNVLQTAAPDSVEYRLTADLLPLPCDQRYGSEEMETICQIIASYV